MAIDAACEARYPGYKAADYAQPLNPAVPFTG